jgi:omega-6 fatty acid desaturase (delta-12 desaturase)
LMKEITNQCQLYKTDIGYITFDEYREEKLSTVK